MIRKIIISLSIFFMISTNLLAAGSSGNDSDGSKKTSKYDQAVKLIKSAISGVVESISILWLCVSFDQTKNVTFVLQHHICQGIKRARPQ